MTGQLSSSRSFNQVVIASSALQQNFLILQQRVGPDIRIMAMVKADGYGHGMIETAINLSRTGCDCFGVAAISDAISLRQAGIKGQIFTLLGFLPSQAQSYFDYDLTAVVFDHQTLDLLSQAAVRNGTRLAVHLKVDCGMGRLGIMPADLQEYLVHLEQCPGLSLAGIMSHFPRADEPGSSHTTDMYQKFKKICARYPQQPPALYHIANSGAALYFPEACYDMVRLGISLYGYYPGGARADQDQPLDKLIPVMSFTSQVIQVKTVPPGSGISYGHSYITDKETTIAVLPVGYADGLLRTLSNKGQVLIKGQRVKIIGRICMNLCMVDISEVQGVEVGDEVVILGSQGSETITADEIAAWMGTISYEVLCLFGNNNARIYI